MVPINEYVDTLVNARRYEIMNESENGYNKICKTLDILYLSKIIRIYKSIIKKFEYLQGYAASNYKNNSFYCYNNKIFLIMDTFWNYADRLYEEYEWGYFETNNIKKSLIEINNKYKRDMITVYNQLIVSLKPLNMTLTFQTHDGNSIDDLCKSIENQIKLGQKISSSGIECCIYPTEAAINKTNFVKYSIKESDKKKYLDLYDKFFKFITNPHKLGADFYSYHISDICKIINMSSKRLNELVSSNIKQIGMQKTFKDNDTFSKYLKKIIGSYYIIDYDGDCEYIFYSINNKRMYYVDYEHEECEIFYNNYPYSSKELEDIVYGDNKSELEAVRKLFKEYDKEKRYNLFQ